MTRDELIAWNDGAVLKMARAILDDRSAEDLPILADACEEAGCNPDSGMVRSLRGQWLHNIWTLTHQVVLEVCEECAKGKHWVTLHEDLRPKLAYRVLRFIVDGVLLETDSGETWETYRPRVVKKEEVAGVCP